MKNLIFTFAILLYYFSSNIIWAQPNIQWTKSFGGSASESAYSIYQTTDHGYILAGYTLSNNGDVSGNHGGYDFWVIKLTETGNIQWKKSLGGSDNEWAYAVQQTTDQGYIIAGYTQSNNGDVSGNHGDVDCWVVKLSSLGTIEWQKTLGGSGWEEAWSVQQTSDGGYIIAGRTTSLDGDVTGFHGGFDFWVVKLSGNGTLEWQKSLGGSGVDIGYAIRQTPDGGYIVTGESDSNDGDASGLHGTASDFWVVKLSASGSLEWQKMLGSTSQDRGNAIQPTKDGGYVVTGLSSWNDGDLTEYFGGYDYWVVKLDSMGVIQWQKSFGGSNEDFAQAIQQTNAGGYIISGSTVSTDGDVVNNDGGVDFWLVKLNAEGQLLWQKTLGGTQAERAFAVQQTEDGGYITVGYALSNDGDVSGNYGNRDFWVVKLSPESTPTSAPDINPLDIFPNPATNTISIRIPWEATEQIICVSDASGRKTDQVMSVNGSSFPTEINISNLPSGIYLISAKNPDGLIYSGKFQKK